MGLRDMIHWGPATNLLMTNTDHETRLKGLESERLEIESDRLLIAKPMPRTIHRMTLDIFDQNESVLRLVTGARRDEVGISNFVADMRLRDDVLTMNGIVTIDGPGSERLFISREKIWQRPSRNSEPEMVFGTIDIDKTATAKFGLDWVERNLKMDVVDVARKTISLTGRREGWDQRFRSRHTAKFNKDDQLIDTEQRTVIQYTLEDGKLVVKDYIPHATIGLFDLQQKKWNSDTYPISFSIVGWKTSDAGYEYTMIPMGGFA